jgi:hypothetical protein
MNFKIQHHLIIAFMTLYSALIIYKPLNWSDKLIVFPFPSTIIIPVMVSTFHSASLLNLKNPSLLVLG